MRHKYAPYHIVALLNRNAMLIGVNVTNPEIPLVGDYLPNA